METVDFIAKWNVSYKTAQEAQRQAAEMYDDLLAVVAALKSNHVEEQPKETTFFHLIDFVVKHGGKIVSSNDLPSELIAQARASNRMCVEANSLGYIWEPPIGGRIPGTEGEVKIFAGCYPPDVEVPSEAKMNEMFDKVIAECKVFKLSWL